MKELSEDEIVKHLTGWQLGGGGGIIICDGCGARLQGSDEPHMTGYATSPRGRTNPIHLLKVYCEDCDNREVNVETNSVDEIMVEFDVIRISPQSMIKNVEIIDRSKYNEGTPP